jgi:hypothetical protein
MPEQVPKLQSPEDVAAGIVEVLRGSVEPTPDGCRIDGPGFGERRLALANARIHQINEILQNKREDGGTVLWDSRTYEGLVREETRFGPSLLLREHGHVRKEDADAGLTYAVGTPTDEYMLFLLGAIGGAAALRALRAPLGSFRVNRILENEGPGDVDALKFFKQLFPRLLTVRVESARPKSVSDLALHSSAYLFQLTYNLDVPLVESRSWEDLLRVSRIARGRRSKVQDIEPPRRVYVPDLLYHYQMGVAADSPVLAFLSYYHIAEHFFEQVFTDDLIASVRDRITQPGFSHRRKKDIDGMIKEISRRLRVRAESTVFSEQEALRLTLQLFVKRDELLNKIRSYDETLVAHYAENQVVFCGGDTVDMQAADEGRTFEQLARRIYKTRNAVVHSKDGDKSRYVPFEHDRILAREVPLARFCAEAIIIGSATVMQ